MKKVLIEKEKYSEESKRSVGHWFLRGFYSDIRYNCIKCKNESTFSAEEQKHAYEVEKEYMHTRRVLCQLCWNKLNEIKKNLILKEAAYLENKESLIKSNTFLEEWLYLLNEQLKYVRKGNVGRIKFIIKHLNINSKT